MDYPVLKIHTTSTTISLAEQIINWFTLPTYKGPWKLIKANDDPDFDQLLAVFRYYHPRFGIFGDLSIFLYREYIQIEVSDFKNKHFPLPGMFHAFLITEFLHILQTHFSDDIRFSAISFMPHPDLVPFSPYPHLVMEVTPHQVKKVADFILTTLRKKAYSLAMSRKSFHVKYDLAEEDGIIPTPFHRSMFLDFNNFIHSSLDGHDLILELNCCPKCDRIVFEFIPLQDPTPDNQRRQLLLMYLFTLQLLHLDISIYGLDLLI